MKTVVVAVVVCCAIAGFSRGGVVEDANEAMTRAFQAESPAPVLAARNLAILHLAMHDAVRVGRGKHRTVLVLPGVAGAKHTDIAVREAALTVCRTLYPGRSADFAALNAAELVSADEKASAATGRQVAMAWLEARKDDGSSTTIHYVPQEAPGQWRRTPPANRPPEMPHWGKVKPFFLKTADQFRPPAPPALDSAEYARALDEVRRLGGSASTERTAAQTETAKFWSDFSYTSTPPGHWNEIARTLSLRRKLSLEDCTRLFALLNAAMADAGIAAWDCKYHWNSWRPVTAIRTTSEADWLPLLATPPHPEYVSGHSAFSWAAATALEGFFETDALSFTAVSDSMPGKTRRFHSLSACAKEVGASRVFGGIHFTFSNTKGTALGRSVGHLVFARFSMASEGQTD